MSYEGDISQLPDDPREMGCSGLIMLKRALREEWIDLGLEDTRAKLGKKIAGYVENMKILSEKEARLAVRLAEVFDAMDNTAIRKVELGDKVTRLDEDRPTENHGFKIIIKQQGDGDSRSDDAGD